MVLSACFHAMKWLILNSETGAFWNYRSNYASKRRVCSIDRHQFESTVQFQNLNLGGFSTLLAAPSSITYNAKRFHDKKTSLALLMTGLARLGLEIGVWANRFVWIIPIRVMRASYLVTNPHLYTTVYLVGYTYEFCLWWMPWNDEVI